MYKQESRVGRIKFAREAGAVSRLHVHRVIGEYDIAQHTYGALCILKMLNPEPRVALIWALLSHDKPERLTGDIPAPAKWVGGWFSGEAYQSTEDHILVGTGWNWEDLTEQEELWLKFCDACEFYMACLDQEALGNRTLGRPKRLIVRYVEGRKDEWPTVAWHFWQELLHSHWEMCEEIGEQTGEY